MECFGNLAGQTACSEICFLSRPSLCFAGNPKTVLAPGQLPCQHPPLRSSQYRLWRKWRLHRRPVRRPGYFADYFRCLLLAQALGLRNEKSVDRFVLGRYLEDVSRVSGSYGWILDLARHSLIDSALWRETDSREIASILGG